ncbi:hypothetical protein LMG7141_03068 [Ralstonia condita]|uniref:DUF5666 domain-containing protein n=1 Tax=Ralstonia condita TaxID=3058600 RepID=A0ABM9JIU0_9RALS|nr:hypothetical protein [Ralstonia sp. LMG 7141]CAJ0795278.1 hypothetical protein LMG7141_03068 [Ralstonia sp. LMG 7141]
MTRHHRSIRAAALTLAAAAFPLIVSAQGTQPPARVRATINAVHGNAVDVTDTSGTKATVALPANVSVTQVAPIEPSAIQAGSYIGTAAVRQADGTLRALEVHVFPEAMRGTGDGHRPYDLGANSSMTNGTVEQAGPVTGARGRTLSVRYKDGEQRIVVPPEVPIVTFAPGRRDELKAGAHVVMFVRADAQGVLTAQRVLVGKDGMVPPM